MIMLNEIQNLTIKESSYILSSHISNNSETTPLVIIFYTNETGYEEYVKAISWAKIIRINILLVNIKGNWQPKQWYYSWKNYQEKKKDIALLISEVIQLNISKKIYFLSNYRTNTFIIDLIKSHYPLKAYLKGFVDENQKFINYHELSLIKSAMNNHREHSIKRFISPLFLRAIICTVLLK